MTPIRVKPCSKKARFSAFFNIHIRARLWPLKHCFFPIDLIDDARSINNKIEEIRT